MQYINGRDIVLPQALPAQGEEGKQEEVIFFHKLKLEMKVLIDGRFAQGSRRLMILPFRPGAGSCSQVSVQIRAVPRWGRSHRSPFMASAMPAPTRQ